MNNSKKLLEFVLGFYRIQLENFCKLAKRLSKEQKQEIIRSFSEGSAVEEISRNFECSKLTIIRNLKKYLGEIKYKEFLFKQKYIQKNNKNIKSELHMQNDQENKTSLASNKDVEENFEIEDQKFNISEFVELTPLNEEIDNANRKDFSSISISDANFPNAVYMIVDKNIELEIKLLKEYSEWSFLPLNDLNRKTIKIYFDLKIAKTFCSKEQKIIKVPNTSVFKIVAPTLRSRGISRIVCPDQLISLT